MSIRFKVDDICVYFGICIDCKEYVRKYDQEGDLVDSKCSSKAIKSECKDCSLINTTK